MTDRTITTDASAERSAVPELSGVELRVTGDGTTTAAARRDASDRAATVRDRLTDVVDDERVRTTTVEVDETDDLFGPDTDLPYQATERLRVDCTPDAVETVVVAATDAGAAVPTVEHALHEGRERALQEEALAAATERAREKAEHVADAEGLRVGSVRSVTTREVDTGMQSIVDDALAEGSSSSLRPSPVPVSATVEVVYELTE
jgi:uncharacterized protein YggE